ncbi:MAG: dUTP diphosphatase [Patescibacteria group bacterium]
MKNKDVKIHLLAGGQLPERQTEGAIGFDVRIRAIVSATEMDINNPHLRKTIFDFKKIPPELKKRVTKKSNSLIYLLKPSESVLVGIGFITAMPFPMFYWVAPRSGLASKYGITVTNAPGTVDPDYRGEAGVLVLNRSKKTFELSQGMRIAQIIFQYANIPTLNIINNYLDLPNTIRSAGGFGHTGLI